MKYISYFFSKSKPQILLAFYIGIYFIIRSIVAYI